jgi:hypothetical protein
MYNIIIAAVGRHVKYYSVNIELLYRNVYTVYKLQVVL